jgi:hypothetical protein
MLLLNMPSSNWSGLTRFATEKEDAAYIAQVEALDKGHPKGAGAFSYDKGLSPLSILKRPISPYEVEDNIDKVVYNISCKNTS